jgi:hypothetical protein
MRRMALSLRCSMSKPEKPVRLFVRKSVDTSLPAAGEHHVQADISHAGSQDRRRGQICGAEILLMAPAPLQSRTLRAFPTAILHSAADAFFESCEQADHPALARVPDARSVQAAPACPYPSLASRSAPCQHYARSSAPADRLAGWHAAGQEHAHAPVALCSPSRYSNTSLSTSARRYPASTIRRSPMGLATLA